MKYALTDYQREAAIELLERLARGINSWAFSKMPTSFALSAITGAGKTVIATAVIEATFHGSADLGAQADPKTAFLWITDDPSLNRQTRLRMMDASDLLVPMNLVEIDEGFLESELSAGHVYFLNTQKLSKTSRLVQSGNDQRQVSFWEVLANTVKNQRTNLVMVLDEAHRGMKRSADRSTIVQRLINGEKGSNPRMPIIWGISATVDRFTKAMGAIIERAPLTNVVVDIEKVRASGLVKDEIGLDQPDESGTFSTTLLRDAVKAIREYDSRWAAYCQAEGESLVLPILVIQVPDKSEKAEATRLREMVEVVEGEWPGLGPDAIVHVFGNHEPITIANRKIERVPPESIQGTPVIRVVLAKEAISTGWDCPRAEVLYSERPAKDATHIAQVIGRMVRQPLAHRIASDDALNSVTCYLPLFDREALNSIKDELEGKGKENGENAVGPEVLRNPKVFERNPKIPADVFTFIETLPSNPTPDKSASPLRRAKSLVRLLADDLHGTALLADADAKLTELLNKRMDGLAAEKAIEVAGQLRDLKNTDVRTSRVTIAGQEKSSALRQIETHEKDLDRDSRRIINSLKEGVGKGYYAYLARRAGKNADLLEIRAKVAALLSVEGMIEAVEEAATKFVQDQLAKFAVEIKNTTGATRDAYRKVQEQTSKPEAVTVELRANEKAATKDRKGNDLPTFSGHLYSDAVGLYPAELNDWETEVIRKEIGRKSFVAWYRNPKRATPNSLRIAYQTDSEKWVSLQVDFIVVSRLDDGTLAASIVDPHSDHLADSKAKLHALADFAEKFGNRFVRIQSIAMAEDGKLRSLDLLEPKVRAAVREFEGGKVTLLYKSFNSERYE